MDTHYPIHNGFDVSLGAMRREYIPLFMAGANDPDVMRGVILKPPVTLESEYAWYDKMAQKQNDIIFAILLHELDPAGKIIGYRYIGHTGLHNITWPEGIATTGTIICDKNCFGKGYGKEAKMLLLLDAFYNRGLRKVCSAVKAFNGSSWGHLLACGYRQVGRYSRHHLYNGRFVDRIEFEIFREDWEPIWEEYQRMKKPPRLTDEQREMLKKETNKS